MSDITPVTRKHASPLAVARAVFWSFFGIRKSAEYDKDAATLNPIHVIIAGVIGAVIFVVSLITVVRFIAG
jgi:hypothetical protein